MGRVQWGVSLKGGVGWGGVHYEWVGWGVSWRRGLSWRGGVGWGALCRGGVGCVMEEEPVMEGWGLSWRGGVGHIQGWCGVGHEEVGWGCHAGVGCVVS